MAYSSAHQPSIRDPDESLRVLGRLSGRCRYNKSQLIALVHLRASYVQHACVCWVITPWPAGEAAGSQQYNARGVFSVATK